MITLVMITRMKKIDDNCNYHDTSIDQKKRKEMRNNNDYGSKWSSCNDRRNRNKHNQSNSNDSNSSSNNDNGNSHDVAMTTNNHSEAQRAHMPIMLTAIRRL